MANMTPTTNATLIPLILAQRALGAVRGNTKIAKFIAKDADYTSEFTVGRTLDIAKRGTLVANLKVPGTPVTPQAPTASKVSLVLDQHYESTFLLENVTEVEELSSSALGYAEDAGTVIVEKMETYLATFFNNFSGTTGTAGVDLTEPTVLDAKKILSDGKAPEMNRALFISTKDEKALLQIDRFVRADALGTDPGRTVDGRLGRIAGFDVYVSQYLEVVAGVPTTHNGALHRDALTMAVRKLPDMSSVNASTSYVIDDETGLVIRVNMAYSPLDLGVVTTIDTLFGAVETRDEFGVDVLS